MKPLPLITILLLTCPVLGDTPPPPATPPIPSLAAVPAYVADEDEPIDVEPVPTIQAPAQAIAGTMIKVTAHGSRNGYSYAWLVIPPLPCEVSDDGKTCIFAHPKPGQFTFILAVSTRRGRVAMTTAVVTLTRLPDDEEEQPPAIARAMVAPSRPEAKDTMTALTAAAKRVNHADRLRVVSGMRMLASGLLQGQISNDVEYQRAVGTYLSKLNQPDLVDAALKAAEVLAGNTDNPAEEGEIINRVATLIESMK